MKPGFFKNEDLAECGMTARVLFSGLWCFADREGRLEDRPRRIKAEIFPYDQCDIEAELNSLAKAGFIIRYQVNGEKYLQVLNFTKHQNPHMKENASTIPAPDLSGASMGNSGTSPADSLNPLTDSLNLIPSIAPKRDVEQKTVNQEFEDAWKFYPKRAGGNPKVDAEKSWNARIKTGVIAEDMLSGVLRYNAYCEATGKVGTEFIMQAKKFFGPGGHFREDWTPSQKGNGHETHQRIDNSVPARIDRANAAKRAQRNALDGKSDVD